jgi:hypothetical protein
MKLSVGLAEAGAREGERLTHLAALSKEREMLRPDRASLLALVKSTQALLEQQAARVAPLERTGVKSSLRLWARFMRASNAQATKSIWHALSAPIAARGARADRVAASLSFRT